MRVYSEQLPPVADCGETDRKSLRFESLWRRVTMTLVLVGLAALGWTREIHPAVSLAVLAAWVVAWRLPASPRWWRPLYTRLVLWLALLPIGAVALVDKFTAVLYLLVFLAMFKCYTLREPADHLQAIVVTFFMFLACSIMMISLAFLMFMMLFLVMLILSMICLTMARDGIRAHAHPDASLRALGHAVRLPRRLITLGLTCMLLVLALTFALFLVMPHFSSYSFPNPWMKRQVTQPGKPTGYSDSISLEPFARIEPDNTPVMQVRLEWEDKSSARPFPGGLRLRGAALDAYENDRWRMSRFADQGKIGNFEAVGMGMPSSVRGPTLVQTIVQKIGQTRRLFGATMPFRFEFPPHSRSIVAYDLLTQSVNLSSSDVNDNVADSYHYVVYSRLIDEASPKLRLWNAAAHARAANRDAREPAADYDPALQLSREQRRANTRLDLHAPLTPTLLALAERHAPGKAPEARILQLMSWFHTQFEYSLTPSTPSGKHPLEGFLTVTHKGHCEYFATAMALMLRARQIPARVVIGFYSTEFNPRERTYTVRQSDAHAWVEAWLDGRGWLTLDPTPPDSRGRASFDRQYPSLWARAVARIRGYWSNYVIDYSLSRQQEMIQRVVASRLAQFSRDLGQAIARPMNEYKWIQPLRTGGGDLRTEEVWRMALLLTAAGALGGVLVLGRISQAARNPAGPRRSRVMFMNLLLSRLSAVGWRRTPSQTPAEFIGEVERQTQGLWGLDWVLDLYHRCRFGQHQPSSDETARANRLIRNIRRTTPRREE